MVEGNGGYVEKGCCRVCVRIMFYCNNQLVGELWWQSLVEGGSLCEGLAIYVEYCGQSHVSPSNGIVIW